MGGFVLNTHSEMMMMMVVEVDGWADGQGEGKDGFKRSGIL
jgi:hypothetical protein